MRSLNPEALLRASLGYTLFNIASTVALVSASFSPSIKQLRSRATTPVSLVITNNCSETIWPAIASEAGTGPDTSGFELASGSKRNLSVKPDWQGRVWGRTNCTFNANGTGPLNSSSSTACTTGDCGGVLNCTATGLNPVTLAEFNLAGGIHHNQTFYDLSLVDGYNLPIGLTYLPGNDSLLQSIPRNLVSPSCIATEGLLTTQTPYGVPSDFTTNATFPLPYETSQMNSSVGKWCPWVNQLFPNPDRPGDGVYPYPVDNVPRPSFNPCYSSCTLTGSAADCCTGSHSVSSKCHPSYYSKQAKSVCPDAYSYAFDDATSTFSVPMGGGWEVVFCPAGRSTDILRRFASVLSELADQGVTDNVLRQASNTTLLEETSSGRRNDAGFLMFICALAVMFVIS